MNEAFLHYMSLFYSYQINLVVLISSIILAVIVLGLVKFGRFGLKQKMLLVYAHVLLLIFPFVFILFNKACQQQILMCAGMKAYAFGIPAIMIGALVLVVFSSYFIVPLFHHNKSKSLLLNSLEPGRFVRKRAKQLGWRKPDIYALDDAKPVAFAFSQVKPSIFVSVGLMETLTKKEVEAVLLHELWHTRSQSAPYKISAFVSRFSPFAAFSGLEKNLSKEEVEADKFAIKIQKTERYINSAKRKVNS